MKLKPLFLATSLIFSSSQLLAAPDFEQAKAEPNKPKNVIVMIGDGLGLGQMEVARHLEYGKNGRLFIESLPHVALVRTHSADKQVTDSAAAGTALATGVKTNNGAIGVDADGNEVDSILDAFQKAGHKVGVISNNTVTDATPAAYTASVANRYSGQPAAARQMLAAKYDVLLGGGWKYFGPKKQNGKDLLPEFEQAGYTLVKDEEQLSSVKDADKLLGLFNESYMNFKLDKDDVNSNEPSLELMTRKAIEVLAKDNTGFFLMVEGARIDHAAHAADIPGVWQETMEFDRTVQQTWQWAEERKDTLVIVLADHETMGMSLTEPMNIDALKKITVSPEFMAGQLTKAADGKTFEPASVKAVVKKYAGFELTDQQVAEFNKHVVSDNGKTKYQYKVGWEIGSLIAEHYQAGALNRVVRENSTTGGHTGNMVPLFAAGPGAQHFDGVMDNTDVPKLIESLM